MISKTELAIAMQDYLEPAGDGRFLPSGPRLRDLVEVRGTFDNAGVCQKLELLLTSGLPDHPTLGPAVAEFLDAVSRAVIREPFNLKCGSSRNVSGASLSWVLDKGTNVITFAKRKGILGSLFG